MNSGSSTTAVITGWAPMACLFLAIWACPPWASLGEGDFQAPAPQEVQKILKHGSPPLTPQGIDMNEALSALDIEELFQERKNEQREQHNCGNYWVGTCWRAWIQSMISLVEGFFLIWGRPRIL